MQVLPESNANILIIGIDGSEQIDRFTLRMLQTRPLKGVMVPGFTETEPTVLRFPTAGLVPASSDQRTLTCIIRAAVRLQQDARRAMIPEQEIFFLPQFTYINSRTKEPVFLVVPVEYLPGARCFYSPPLPVYFRVLAAQAFMPPQLLQIFNSPNISSNNFEELLAALEKAGVSQTPPPACKSAPAQKAASAPKSAPAPVPPEKKNVSQRHNFFSILSHFFSDGEEAAEGGHCASAAAGGHRASAAEGAADDFAEAILAEAQAREQAERTDRSAQAASVLVLRGTGQTFPLDAAGGSMIIGADPVLADIVLPNNVCAAREHCRIYREHGGCYFIEDLNTENGTFLNGERVKMYEPKPLEAADVIRVGDDEIIFSKRY